MGRYNSNGRLRFLTLLRSVTVTKMFLLKPIIVMLTKLALATAMKIDFFKDFAEYLQMPSISMLIDDGERSDKNIEELQHFNTYLGYDLLLIQFQFEDCQEKSMYILESTMKVADTKNCTWLMPLDSDFEKLVLRLDSRVYAYSEQEINNITYIILFEVFAYKNGPRKRRNIGNWSSQEGLHMSTESTWTRRSDLSGANIRVVFIYLNFIVELNEGGLGGRYGEIMNTLADICNFTMSFEERLDGNYGKTDSNADWDGLVSIFSILHLFTCIVPIF